MSQEEQLAEVVEGKRQSALRGNAGSQSGLNAFAAEANQTQEEKWANYTLGDDDFYGGEEEGEVDGNDISYRIREKPKKEKKERPPKEAKPKQPKAAAAASQSSQAAIAGQRSLVAMMSQTQNQKLDLQSMMAEMEKREQNADDDIDTNLLNQLLTNDEDDDGSDADINETEYLNNILFGKNTAANDDNGDAIAKAEQVKQEQQQIKAEAESAIVFQQEDYEFAGQKSAQQKAAPARPAAALPSGSPTGAAGINFVQKKEEQMSYEIKSEIKVEADDDTHVPMALEENVPSDAKFYWFDAKENGMYHHAEPGSVTLIGKYAQRNSRGMNEWSSCCVRVRNMQRCVMILPKEGVDEIEVIGEINQICRDAKIESRKCKVVERRYAFEDGDLPREQTKWIKVRYPATYPAFPTDRNFRTIAHVAGANRSLLELLLVKRRFKGPSMLALRNPQPVPLEHRISHCALELVVDGAKSVTPIEGNVAPPLTAASIQLTTQLDANGTHNEVFAASITICRRVDVNGGSKKLPSAEHFVAVRQFDQNTALPLDTATVARANGMNNLQTFASESSLLQWIIATIRQNDPDLLVGHNFLSFTLDVLLHRFAAHRIATWSILGRLFQRQMPKLQSGAGGTQEATFQEREVCVGRLVIDTYQLAREYYKTNNYKLLNLAMLMKIRGLFGEITPAIAETSMPVVTRELLRDAKKIFEMMAFSLNATVLSLSVAYHLDVIPLTKRLCSLAGTLWSRTLNGSRAERIEYLLLHAFHDLKFITPDKRTYAETKKRSKRDDDDDDNEDEGKRKAKYKGGMVLEPRRGLYTDYVMLLDFNSLYPSIIQEFNICFSTVQRFGDDAEGESEIPEVQHLACRECTEAGAPAPCPHRCILPRVIRTLVESRREVKKMMKNERDENMRAQLNIRQLALKLTANSMYGCLGFEHSRFYAQPLAELVTRMGRQALQNTVDLVPTVNASLSVIYGDTDSVMIQTGVRDDLSVVRDLAESVKREVNKRYRSLEIDIDGIFRSILLSRKKKYAALVVEDWAGPGKVLKKEVKGLDMVRRDWCSLVRQACDSILDKVLKATHTEEVIDFINQFMRSVALHIRSGDLYELGDFVISKSLTKEPEHYKGGSFPHATVALRMKENKEAVRVGDLIPYVICEVESQQQNSMQSKLTSKAFHPDEVKAQKLRIDCDWYLETQIFPPVVRICEQIQGFEAQQLAESMELKHQPQGATAAASSAASELPNADYSAAFKSAELEDCYPGVELLQVVCGSCQKVAVVQPHQAVEALLKENTYMVQPKFHPFCCNSCSRPLRLSHVTNTLMSSCNRAMRRFYLNGGTTAEVTRLRRQIAYFRALFDVPHMPGVTADVKQMHIKKALRCMGSDGNPISAEAAEKDEDAVNPPLEYVKLIYNTVESMTVSLDKVCAGMRFSD